MTHYNITNLSDLQVIKISFLTSTESPKKSVNYEISITFEIMATHKCLRSQIGGILGTFRCVQHPKIQFDSSNILFPNSHFFFGGGDSAMCSASKNTSNLTSHTPLSGHLFKSLPIS